MNFTEPLSGFSTTLSDGFYWNYMDIDYQGNITGNATGNATGNTTINTASTNLLSFWLNSTNP